MMRRTLAGLTTVAVLVSGCGLVSGARVQEENVEEHGDVVENVEERVEDIDERQRDRYPTPEDGG